MSKKPLQYVLIERKLNLGAKAGQTVQIAKPTGRHRVDFRSFCERVAKSTTFNRQEVEAVLNYATEIAKDIVSNGDIVEFGDLGTLMPSFKSKAVEQGEKFRANIHIEKPVVLLQPSKKYFTLTDVSYEQTTPKSKDTKKSSKSSETSESSSGTSDPGRGTGGSL